jgi:hypothetical protein
MIGGYLAFVVGIGESGGTRYRYGMVWYGMEDNRNGSVDLVAFFK